jgi:hypothetical protein
LQFTPNLPHCDAGEWDGAGAVLKSRLRAE